jgi:NAD-dependent SIR2 family protein deacetylase
MTNSSDNIAEIKRRIEIAEAIVIGAGAGLSSAAGLEYSGKRFQKYFYDFIEKYGFTDMYSGGFYPFETPEEYWAYWSRYIFVNRFECTENGVYKRLLKLVENFVQDEGWHSASKQYGNFIEKHGSENILFLELGVGYNTPGIIKFPFWKITAKNPEAFYICVNFGEVYVPDEIKKRAICVNSDINEFLKKIS